MRLVLASASPRRRQLLAELGLPFTVVASRVEEAWPAGLSAKAAALSLALRKAWNVARRFAADGVTPTVVLGADTLVVVEGLAFGKPASAAEARHMLTELCGRVHEVVTGVGLVEVPSGRELAETVVSRVRMRAYPAEEIEAYLASGEPYDKAGAYAVQGEGGRLVAAVEGSLTNVIGLPLAATARLLKVMGFEAVEPPEPRLGPGPRRG
jgi:septum formation protein